MDNDNMGLRLIKKGKNGIMRTIFSRLGLIIILLLLQFIVLFGMFFWFEQHWQYIFGAVSILSVIMVQYLLNNPLNATAKTTWLVIIMAFPVFGTLLFLFTKLEFGYRLEKEKVTKLINDTKNSILQDEAVIERLETEAPEVVSLYKYINRSGCFPVYENADIKYFPLGEDKFKELLIQLKQAKKYIFLEYFIIDEGLMWGKILEILVEKAAEGVEVRVMYDGMCELALLPYNYPQKLEALGIKCKMFSPITPFVSTHYNYRDHRKILVIDGHTAFTGGINFADEYINHIERFGHWKDTAVMVKGEAAKSFTLMFLQMWNVMEKNPEIDKYLTDNKAKCGLHTGYVIPYADSPFDDDKVGEYVYMDIINRAKSYVHIMTPYLILDCELESALKFAAKRGVDVKIILPGIPDKKIAYSLAKTHYISLIDAGVKIYEYTPGFVHAKVFVSDGCKAVVGTINLDYRSLYHHFECAAYMYKAECISDIENDFADTLSKCREATKEAAKHNRYRWLGWALKVISPLM